MILLEGSVIGTLLEDAALPKRAVRIGFWAGIKPGSLCEGVEKRCVEDCFLQRFTGQRDTAGTQAGGVLVSGSLLGIPKLHECGTADAAGTAQRHCPQFLFAC